MRLICVKKLSCVTAFVCLLLTSAVSAQSKTIDVLYLVSLSATTVSQGQDIPARAALFTEYANQTYANSEVDITLRTVRIEQVSIAGDSGVSIDALRNIQSNQHVQQLREESGADLVVLLTLRQPYGSGFICGIGYVPYGSNGQLYSYAKYAGFSVSAVNCGTTTPVHEFGHNMGLGHSYVQGSTGGIYPWARGHGEFDNFATIMAYPSAYGRASRAQQFSSPLHIKCNGRPCGVDRNQVDGADAVANLNMVAKQVSDFFPTKVTDPTNENSGNLVADGSFDKLDAWGAFSGSATLELTDVSVAGANALLVRDRAMAYSGPAQSISLESGKTYEFSAHAALSTEVSAWSYVYVVAVLAISDDAGFRYQTLDYKLVASGQWSKLGSTFTFNSVGNNVDTQLWFFGPSAQYDFLLDEVEIKVAQ